MDDRTKAPEEKNLGDGEQKKSADEKVYPHEYAKKNCKNCYGRGIIVRIINKTHRHETMCGCAMRNYQREKTVREEK